MVTFSNTLRLSDNSLTLSNLFTFCGLRARGEASKGGENEEEKKGKCIIRVFLTLSLLLITYSKKASEEDEVLLHVKNLGGLFSLCVFVDDVDNEPPVLLGVLQYFTQYFICRSAGE